MKSIKILLMAVLTILSVSLFAQNKAGKKDVTPHKVFYTCPMHDTIAMTKPGNCPICGMKLQLSKKEEMKMGSKKNYSCPIHITEVSDKPGKCPECGKDLVLTPKEKMKMQAMKLYTCPMHPDVTSDKSGKCPKCGMDLTPVKKKTNTKD